MKASWLRLERRALLLFLAWTGWPWTSRLSGILDRLDAALDNAARPEVRP